MSPLGFGHTVFGYVILNEVKDPDLKGRMRLTPPRGTRLAPRFFALLRMTIRNLPTAGLPVCRQAGRKTTTERFKLMRRDLKGAMPIQKITSIGGYSFGVIAIMAAIIIGVALYAVFADEDGEPSAAMAGRTSGGGCFLKDDAFTDTDTVGTAENVVEKLEGQNQSRAKDQIDKVREIISEAKSYSYNDNSGNPQVGVNPAILVSFWAGEQSFDPAADSKAFGCGDFNGSDKGFDKQIACALPRIRDTILVKGEYTDPTGANRWNRLLYSYVAAARKASYDKYGYVSDANEPRIVILKQIVPDQVECITSTGGIGGDKPADFFINKKQNEWLTTKNSRGDSVVTGTINPSGVVLHYTAGSSVDGAISGMRNRPDPAFVHLIIDYDGKVYQLLPLNTKVRSGSGDGNSFAIGIEIVGTDENDLLASSHQAQFDSVIKTIKYLEGVYDIPNEIGNKIELRAHRGIFGHLQTQSWDGDWSPGAEGCVGAKSDPGREYMIKVWSILNAERVGQVCSWVK